MPVEEITDLPPVVITMVPFPRRCNLVV